MVHRRSIDAMIRREVEDEHKHFERKGFFVTKEKQIKRYPKVSIPRAERGRYQELTDRKEQYKQIDFQYADTLRIQAGKCTLCGYDEFVEALQVHHKDRNRHNNERYNLVVLCPICHYLIHRGLKELPK